MARLTGTDCIPEGVTVGEIDEQAVLRVAEGGKWFVLTTPIVSFVGQHGTGHRDGPGRSRGTGCRVGWSCVGA